MLALFVLGTRPEVIKLSPVILECRKRRNIDVIVCSTGQHRQMLDQAFGSFGITPEIDLGLMTVNQSLTDLSAAALTALGKVFESHKPDAVIVQGDTTTAMIGALAAYYHRIPVVHVEAGLRTWDRFNPFPEEGNRAIIDQIADYCMAPTAGSEKNLLAAGVTPDRITVTGNTAVDAILSMAEKVSGIPAPESLPEDIGSAIADGVKTIVVTGHRRESFGEDFESICRALRRITEENTDVQIVYPVHLNPNVREPVFRILKNVQRIHLVEPLPYLEFVWLLAHSFIVLTDSGGIQEEVPSLNKPILVMRSVTERPEGVDAGCAKLVGVDEDVIVKSVNELLTDPAMYTKMIQADNPYGDGEASRRIADVLQEIPNKND
ncbi:MAG: UDP-N-acetylglucosamine 2-epimerase (non-hydrolyzing) [Chloroflexi bacterium]|nr:UDP-N-acetylglucosamine 2-epimerase (non-hydrolyzing) [Chloroflexota bacterium]